MDIENEVKSAMPEIMARIKAESIGRLERQAIDAAVAVGVEAAKQWATENLVPEVKAQLEAGKMGMVKAAETASAQLGEAVSAALLKAATERIGNSYYAREMMKAMFG